MVVECRIAILCYCSGPLTGGWPWWSGRDFGCIFVVVGREKDVGLDVGDISFSPMVSGLQGSCISIGELVAGKG